MRLNSYFVPLILALILHGVVLFILADVWFEPEREHIKVPRHVNAQIVDLKTLASYTAKKREAEAAQKRAAKNKAAADAKRNAATEAKRKKAIADKKRADIARKKAAEKKQKEIARKRAAEKKRKLKAKKTAEKKKQDLARKKAAESKRAKDLAAKKRAKDKADTAAKAEAERQRKSAEKLAKEQRVAEEAARAQAREDALAKAIAEEAALMAEEENLQSAMSYEAYIRESISRYWRRSPNARNGMVVELSIRLLPSGEVDDAFVSKSSGDDRFDRDAIRAVLRAESFPELRNLDPVVFDRYYRKFKMVFRPEDLRY